MGPRHVFQFLEAACLLIALFLDTDLWSFHSSGSNFSHFVVLILYEIFVSLEWQRQWEGGCISLTVWLYSPLGRGRHGGGSLRQLAPSQPSQEAELTFFFSVSPDPSPWNDPSHTQGESSHLNYPKQCIFHTVCILGDSGPGQGDDLSQSAQVPLSVHVLSASRWRLVGGHEPSCSEQSYVTLLH